MPMNILAIETSSDACSAALSLGNEVVEVFRVAPRAHTQLILPMMEEVLAQADVSLQQLDALAFGRGPGAFTGVRVATSVIQGVALGVDLPVIPVSSLAALAHYGFRLEGYEQSIVAVDARLGEVYTACYAIDDGYAELIGQEHVLKPEALPQVAPGQWLAIGNAWSVYAQALTQQVDDVVLTKTLSDVYPHAHDVACLARFGQQVAAEHALPVYLRDKVTS